MIKSSIHGYGCCVRSRFSGFSISLKTKMKKSTHHPSVSRGRSTVLNVLSEVLRVAQDGAVSGALMDFEPSRSRINRFMQSFYTQICIPLRHFPMLGLETMCRISLKGPFV